MDEIARMRFKSAQRPREHGTLAINEDGTFQVHPSPDLRAEMARLEEKAVRRAQVFGTGLGTVLLVAGAAAVVAGWLAGRLFGNVGSTLGMPRNLRDVDVTRDDNGQVTLRMRALESKLQTVSMTWNCDEVLDAEAEAFVEKLKALKEEGYA